MTTTHQSRRKIPGATVVLAILIFFLDAPFPGGRTSAMLLGAVVGATLWPPGLHPILVASAWALLTVLSFLRCPHGPIAIDPPDRSRSIREDGREVPASPSASPVRDAAGRVMAISSLVADLAGRERAERELREREERVRPLLDSTGEAIDGIDLDGRCTFCNPACPRLLGYADAGDLLGEDMHRPVHHTRAETRQGEGAACGS